MYQITFKHPFNIVLLSIFLLSGDNTPPSMAGVCNGDIHATADKYQVNTRVSWPENSANDDRDGRVSYV